MSLCVCVLSEAADSPNINTVLKVAGLSLSRSVPLPRHGRKKGSAYLYVSTEDCQQCWKCWPKNLSIDAITPTPCYHQAITSSQELFSFLLIQNILCWSTVIPLGLWYPENSYLQFCTCFSSTISFFISAAQESSNALKLVTQISLPPKSSSLKLHSVTENYPL